MIEHPLAAKLSSFTDLTLAERNQIDDWSTYTTQVPVRKTIVRQGDRPGPTCLVLSGWAYRYKDIRNGKRQVVGVLLPGDMCDLHGFLLRTTDHGITALSDMVVAQIPSSAVEAGLDANPGLARALWWSTLVDEGTTREWLVNTGQRDATTRVAHLFCELWVRADRVGLISNGALDLPLTQTDLADCAGLTPVHINRVLKTIREAGLAAFQSKRLNIPNVDQLKRFAGFDPTYLQLDRRGDRNR